MSADILKFPSLSKRLNMQGDSYTVSSELFVAANNNIHPEIVEIAIEAVIKKIHEIAEYETEGKYNEELLELIVLEESRILAKSMVQELGEIQGTEKELERFFYSCTDIPHFSQEIEIILGYNLLSTIGDKSPVFLV